MTIWYVGSVDSGVRDGRGSHTRPDAVVVEVEDEQHPCRVLGDFVPDFVSTTDASNAFTP